MEIKKLNYGWGVKLAVLLIICVQYTVTITSPILGTIMEAFPEHASMVKLLETIPTFAAVIISILLGPLMKVFYKKQLLLFGIALSFFQFIPPSSPASGPCSSAVQSPASASASCTPSPLPSPSICSTKRALRICWV